jgi:putative transposase
LICGEYGGSQTSVTLPGTTSLRAVCQPARRRERQMKRFESARQAQRFLSAHDQVSNLFHLRRDHVTAAQRRAARARTFEAWAEISGIAAAAA